MMLTSIFKITAAYTFANKWPTLDLYFPRGIILRLTLTTISLLAHIDLFIHLVLNMLLDIQVRV